ncbi:uncharacterized protein LOC134230780 [Saccostrea cucullata]|uniref:uncharacterized protein LOC134230780 n=1 Tax=Saccostrea cuccullata TaxID=36930 RepID=UPI002ECFD782
MTLSTTGRSSLGSSPSSSSSTNSAEKYNSTTNAGIEDVLDMILADMYTKLMGGIVGFMFIITVVICFKTRILKKKKNLPKNPVNRRSHLENVIIDRPAEGEGVAEGGGGGERNSNEFLKDYTNGHEDYALVNHTDKCYADLEQGEYDLLRSHRKYKTCSTEPTPDSCYDKVKNDNSPYDLSGVCNQKDALITDYEYEMIKNLAKKKQSKELTESECKISPKNGKSGTGDNSYEDAISKKSTMDNTIKNN